MRQRLNLISLEDLYQTLIDTREFMKLIDAPPDLQNLRGNTLKGPRQHYHAAMFARAWQGAHRIEKIWVSFPDDEYCEYDARLHWWDGPAERLALVQLKEFPPEELSPDETLDGIIARAAAKYVRSPNLVLAVFINRAGRYATVKFPPHELGGLFTYGICCLEPKMLYIAGQIGNRGWRATIPLEIYRKPEAQPTRGTTAGGDVLPGQHKSP